MAIQPLELKNISVSQSFWHDYQELIRTKVIPYQWKALNNQLSDAPHSSCIQNFLIAAGKMEGKHEGFVFQDSDIMKWLEAVAFSLINHPDPELEALADQAIDIICDAQQPDGYLNTYYIINNLNKRFTNLRDNHELYCLGHMLEAAIAYAKATQKTKLLDAAARYVHLVNQTFGHKAHQIPGYPGHEIIELALTMLYDYTQNAEYLNLAEYFILNRGQSPLYFDIEADKYHNNKSWSDTYMGLQYYQAGQPVLNQMSAQGHAVRAVYLYAGMAATAYHTHNSALLNQCRILFDNIADKQMYITGGIGSSAHGESFTFDYDLPNDTVYSETCAAIGLVFFAKQMLRNEVKGKYADVMERALYNTVIAGMGLDGQSFFYVNPLEVNPESSLKDLGKSHIKVSRQKWFGCACCPPNIARLLSSLGSYAYAASEDTVYCHLYMDSQIDVPLSSGMLSLSTSTNYPWDGTIQVTCTNTAPVNAVLALRIPSWCRHYSLLINNVPAALEPEDGYLYISRTWQVQDQLTLNLSMPVELNVSHPSVRSNLGRLCVSRGPLIYCLEEEDNGSNLHRIFLDPDESFKLTSLPSPLEKMTGLSAAGKYLSFNESDTSPLYSRYARPAYTDKPLIFIPYFAWANRSAGEMLVWIHSL